MIGVLVFFVSQILWAYPVLESFENNPTLVYENKKKVTLKKQSVLTLPFVAVTQLRDRADIKINNFDKLVIYPQSKMQILNYANEGDFVPEFYFFSGKLRYSVGFRGVAKSENAILMKTPFFELKLDSVVDFVVELDMNKAWTEIKVIKGSLPLEFFAYEKKLTLKEGESVRFEGELADDKISLKYDYLLNDKKVPKGRLLEVQPFNQAKYLMEEDKVRKIEQKRKKDIEFRKNEKVRKQKEYEDSFLCKLPFGQRDQCSWHLEEGKCIRRRCNVSGQWGDLIERPGSAKCKAEFTVADCDY